MGCDECEEAHRDHKTVPPCFTCDKPILAPENEEAFRVYLLCRHQLITTMEAIIGIRLEAVKVAMDLLGVVDQVVCADKVITYTEALYSKESDTEMMGEDKKDVQGGD